MGNHGDCYCHICEKEFDSMGIAGHRAMHRRKKEYCKITYTNGLTYEHDFGNQ